MSPRKAYLNAMLPVRAKEKAFMNSVVLGTSANKVTPRNFSGMPEPSNTTSTTSTRISVSACNTVSLQLQLKTAQADHAAPHLR